MPLGLAHSQFLSWDPQDQDLALAWHRGKRELCGGCGTRAQDWERDRFAYIGQQRACPGCEVLGQERENVPEHAKGHTYVYLSPPELARTPEQEEIAE